MEANQNQNKIRIQAAVLKVKILTVVIPNHHSNHISLKNLMKMSKVSTRRRLMDRVKAHLLTQALLTATLQEVAVANLRSNQKMKKIIRRTLLKRAKK